MTQTAMTYETMINWQGKSQATFEPESNPNNMDFRKTIVRSMIQTSPFTMTPILRARVLPIRYETGASKDCYEIRVGNEIILIPKPSDPVAELRAIGKKIKSAGSLEEAESKIRKALRKSLRHKLED